MREDIYQKIRDHSFNLAYYMTKDYNDSEDITQIVSIKFLENKEKVENPIAWSRTVTKNEVYNRAKQLKKSEILVETDKFDNYAGTLEDFLDNLEESDKVMSEIEIKELLSRDDFRIYKHLKSCDFVVNKMAKKLKLTYYSAHTRAYKMKRNLKAKKLLNEGYTTSRDIIGYSMNKNIVKFIKLFVQKMKENDLASLHSYLENIDKAEIECLDIAEVLDYEIRIKDDMIHEIVIPHKNSNKQVNFCCVRFKIDKQKKIKVFEFVSKPKTTIPIKISKNQIYKILPKIEKGQITASFEKIKKILLKDIHNDL
ncbi:MAG: hypothetical protein DRI23_05650 [Candidatus Cloacimonadota bacterium]|nr:MAG: hypothetical protein DRI23_05650 [Candidatus Cloacimonadota bacterium]